MMMMASEATIVPIVEGHGEVFAVPVLLRRLAELFAPQLVLHIPHPIRRSRSRLLLEGELEKDVALAAGKIRGAGAIIIILDSDGDCPAILGPAIMNRASVSRPDRTIRVVLAHREYEAWFLAAGTSIAGKRGLPAGFAGPSDPEEVQGAKEWLKQRMTGTRTYSETADQQAFTAIFDLDAARRSRSFDRLCRMCQRLFQELADRIE